MEVLRRRRRCNDLHVVFGGEEQETLESGARMLRAFAFEGVRQKQYDAAQAAPFVFGTADELIDDHLGGVDEVAVLGFPKDEPFGVIERVAVLEAHRAGFAERAVDDVDAGLVVGEVVEDTVFVAVDDVVQHGMPLAERAAFGILAGEADGMPFDGERGKCQRFGGRPIERLFALGHFLATLERPLQLLVEMKSLGSVCEPFEKLL